MSDLKRLCNFMWANSPVGTSISSRQSKLQSSVFWQVDQLLTIVHNFPSKYLQKNEPQDVAAAMVAASEIIEHMIHLISTRYELTKEIGIIYRFVYCEYEFTYIKDPNSSISIKWQTTKHGTFFHPLAIKDIRGAVICPEWDVISHIATDNVNKLSLRFAGKTLA